MRPNTKSLIGAPFMASLAFAAVLLAGCAQTTATAPRASAASARDLAFMTDLYDVVAFDRQVIREEQASAGDPRVEALAADLLAQANAMDAKVAPIAARDGITPPNSLSFKRIADRRARLDAIAATGHYDPDAEFLTDEITSHREAVADVGTYIREPSGDPALKTLSTEGIIRLRFNLQRLEALQKERLAAK
jgi:predicted outer membrane protein